MRKLISYLRPFWIIMAFFAGIAAGYSLLHPTAFVVGFTTISLISLFISATLYDFRVEKTVELTKMATDMGFELRTRIDDSANNSSPICIKFILAWTVDGAHYSETLYSLRELEQYLETAEKLAILKDRLPKGKAK